MSIAKHIFLTGATGVLGRELVPRLFRQHPGARITCLLRPDRDGSIVERLESLRSALRSDSVTADASELDAVAGDIAVPGLGLDAGRRRDLRHSVTHVIHGAATTRLDEAPEIAESINFDGTVRVLAFAESCRKLELFAHVSTVFVCGDREGLVLEGDLWRGQRFLNAYESSKCRAEFEVRRRSLELPVAVFRPSIIVGDSRDGHICSFGSLYSPLRHIAEGTLRWMPCSADARVDLIPVDYVAEAIARLTAQPRAIGEVYQLCAGPGRRVTVEHLFGETIRIAGNGAGPPMRFDPHASRVAPEGTPPRLSVFFDYLHFDRDFSIARVQEHLGADVVSLPSDFLTPMLEFCRRTDWGRRPALEEVAA
jgi:thioester reductase-like protein